MKSASCEDVRAKLAEKDRPEGFGELLGHIESCEACRDRIRQAVTSLSVTETGIGSEEPSSEGSAEGDPRTSDAPLRKKEQVASRGRALPLGAAVVAVLGAGWLFLGAAGHSSDEPQRAESAGAVVEQSTTSTDEQSNEICRDGACRPAVAGAELGEGDVVRTSLGGRLRIKFDSGTYASLDRATTLAFERGRGVVRLERGVALVEAPSTPMVAFEVAMPRGQVSARHATFVAKALDSVSSVEVLRGTAEVSSVEGSRRSVGAGRILSWIGDKSPRVTLAGSSSSRPILLAAEHGSASENRGVGELRAKKVGSDEERVGAVSLQRHSAKVRVVDGFARFEIDETFENSSDDVLEGIYRFPLPPDAQIERLALEVDGRFEEGAFVDRDRAAAIWRGAIVNAGGRPTPREEIVWVPGPWKDPALLEWQRGGRFDLRIFPIPKRGTRRVVLAYTLALPSLGGVRRLSVPLPYVSRRDRVLDALLLDVEVRGHDRNLGLNVHGYDVIRSTREDAESLHFERRSFLPSGDFTVEFASRDRDTSTTSWAYALSANEAAPNDLPEASARFGGATFDDPRGDYLAVAIRPEWPASDDGEPRAIALVVDSSRSMLGENHRRASELAVEIVRALDVNDRFTVLACDVGCRALGELRHPDSTSEAAVAEFLRANPPEGASDPSGAILAAAQRVARESGFVGRVLFIGDGTPTAGPIRPATLSAAIRDGLPSDVGMSAVAVGPEADYETLAALARAGRGVVVGYEPGRVSSDVAVATLAAMSGSALSDLRVELPPELDDVAPQELPTLLPGQELLLAARMRSPSVRGTIRLSGQVGGVPLSLQYPLEVESRSGNAHAFVPRLHAALRIRDLERDGSAPARARAIGLSSQFDVASRYTSLLVLESPAMFRAFGLDNRRVAPDWSGEQAAAPTLGEAERSSNEDPSESKKETAADSFAPGFDSSEGSGNFGPAAPLPLPPSPSHSPAAKAAPARAAAAPHGGIADAELASGGGFAEPPPDPRSRQNDEPRRPKPIAFPERRQRPLVPMRVVWEREFGFAAESDAAQFAEDLAALETDLARNPNRREVTKSLVVRHLRAGRLDRAESLLDTWLEKEPLDADALTARAELFASMGQRERAVRARQSLVDVRPSDSVLLLSLASALQRAGDVRSACSFAIAAAELRRSDAALLGEAVRCSREVGMNAVATAILQGSDESVRLRAEKTQPKADDAVYGELRIEASWTGDGELDVVLLDPDGRSIGWLAAPAKVTVRAKDVIAPDHETIAVSGLRAGAHDVVVRRARGRGTLRGELKLTGPSGFFRRVPFVLDGDRLNLGSLRSGWKKRLVPLEDQPLRQGR